MLPEYCNNDSCYFETMWSKKITMRSFFILLGLLSVIVLPTLTQARSNDYQIMISKKNKELLIQKEGEIVKRYHIATGKGGKGTKRRKGDSKTPLGVYRITKLKDSSRFHFFIQLDYPNLIDAWYGYKNKTIDGNEFKRIAAAYKKRETPPQDTELGGLIGIHGLGDTNEEKLTIHQEINWTEGCIALTNEEVNDLKNFIDIGTTVIIKE